MITNRFRKDDGRIDAGGARYENYTRANCTGAPLLWNAYYTFPARTHLIGTYRNMDDCVGDRPNRKLGIAGYRFHPMSSASLTIESGDGSGAWIIQAKAETCSAPYNHKVQHRRISTGTTYGRQLCGFTYPIDPSGRLHTPLYLDPRAAMRARALAVTECLSKLGRGGSQTNLGEALAEVDKSLAIASDILNSARKIASKRGLLAKCKEVGNVYLLVRYGFKPLVSDIFAVLEAIDATLGEVLETTRVGESVQFTNSWTTSSNDASTFTIAGIVNRVQTVSYKATALNRYRRSLLDAIGLGYKQLVTLPWELVSYSFVVDWFANVGDYIGSLVPDPSIEWVGSCLVETITTQDVWSLTGYTFQLPSTHDVLTPPGAASCRQTYTVKNRTTGLPLPELVIKNDFRFSHLTRALDASALLLQKLKG